MSTTRQILMHKLPVRLASALTLLCLGGFLVLAPLTTVRVRAGQREEEEEQASQQLVRSGGEESPGSMVAVSVLFLILVFVGLHAYTTQIYPSS